MKKRKIEQVNSKSTVTIQGVKKQKKKKNWQVFDHQKNMAWDCNEIVSEGGKGETVHSGNTSKTSE